MPPRPNPQKTIRRTFEPTRVADVMLKHAYEHLVPQSVRVIECTHEPVAKTNAQAR